MRSRFGRGLLAAALLIALVPAGWGFVRVTLGSSEEFRQVRPPPVELFVEDRAAIVEVPHYDDAIPVLTFHDVSEDTTSPYTVTPKRFAEHMEALDEAGFHTVTGADVDDLVSGRRPNLPPRPILITFDDGITSAWRAADPILADHGFNAVALIVTSRVASSAGPAYYLDWATLRKMLATGRWEIGGHTHEGHRTGQTSTGEAPRLSNLLLDETGRTESFESWSARVTSDLATNRQEIVDHLGIEPKVFAYPFSAASDPTNDPRVAAALPRLVGEAFDVALVNRNLASAVVGTDAPTLLPRLGSVMASETPSALIRRISDSVPQPPPPDITALTWLPDGVGACTAAEGTVTVSSARGGYATCTPDVVHTERWTDYTLSATVSALSSETTSSISLRSTTDGRVEVSIGGGSVVVQQLVGGTWTVLDQFDVTPGSSRTGRSVVAQVQGDQLTVSIDGDPGDPIDLDPSLAHGVVSFGTTGRSADGSRFVDVLLQAR